MKRTEYAKQNSIHLWDRETKPKIKENKKN